MQNQTGAPGVKVHALEVHDNNGNHLRTHLQLTFHIAPVGFAAGAVSVERRYRGMRRAAWV